jgi:hypothetical protein
MLMIILSFDFVIRRVLIPDLLSTISDSQNRLMPVTPIQGPIFVKNNSVPVVPLYAYPKVYNGTFMQIPVSI